jgi:hypothetical protein
MARADLVAPCGTAAAARRHHRRGEKPCIACALAASQYKAQRAGASGRLLIDPRPLRNGLPATPGYQYRARAYPWAERILAAAETRHGPAVPTCAACTGPMDERRAQWTDRCYDCAGDAP